MLRVVKRLVARPRGWNPERVLRVVASLALLVLCAHVAAASGDGVYLLLKLRERRLYLMEGAGRPARSFPVAVGRKEWETPVGRFEVTEKIVDPPFVRFDYSDPDRVFGTMDPGPENPLGRRWIGFTSAYGWRIGFHGTPREELLGQAVSHGCVRMRNVDVVEVFDRVAVGTPVVVRR